MVCTIINENDYKNVLEIVITILLYSKIEFFIKCRDDDSYGLQ